MPISYTTRTIADTWTASKLLVQIDSLLKAIGFNVVAPNIYSVTAPVLVAPKDKAFIRVDITQTTATQIRFQVNMGDGVAGTALTNNAPLSDKTLNYGTNELFSLRFVTLNSAEVKLVAWYRKEHGAIGIIGIIFPSIKPEYWPNNALYALGGVNDQMLPLRFAAGSPLGAGNQDCNYIGSFPASENPAGYRDIIKRLIIPHSAAIAGQTGADIGFIAAGGLGMLAEYETMGEVWLNIRDSSSISFRIA